MSDNPNNDCEAVLRLKADVPDKHWRLFDPYFPGFAAAAADPFRDGNGSGTGFYCFRVQ